MFVFGNNETQRVHARRSLRDKKKTKQKTFVAMLLENVSTV